MGNIKFKVLFLFLLFTFASCDMFEVEGFFTSGVDVNKRFDQSIEWNNKNGYTELNIQQNDYVIYAMGDSHVGGTKNLDIFFKDALDKNALAAVMVGDITTGHEEDYQVLSEHLPLNNSLSYFAVAGNHDLFFDGWKYFYSLFGSSSYFFVVNTINASDLFICLDTGGGTLGNKQLEWFKELLETNRGNYRYCTVFTHNNIFRLRPTITTNPMVEEIRVLSDLFLRYNVNMVVTGHDHKQNVDIFGNTTHIIMDALEDTNKKASYLILSFNDKNIDYSFVAL